MKMAHFLEEELIKCAILCEWQPTFSVLLNSGPELYMLRTFFRHGGWLWRFT